MPFSAIGARAYLTGIVLFVFWGSLNMHINFT